MKNVICVLLIVSITVVGCAGNAPHLIAIYQPGDENKSCSALKAEIANLDNQITRKGSQKKEQEGENILWFIGGLFLIVPFFFMDLKDNEEAEIEALQHRKDALVVIAAEKGCEF